MCEFSHRPCRCNAMAAAWYCVMAACFFMNRFPAMRDRKVYDRAPRVKQTFSHIQQVGLSINTFPAMANANLSIYKGIQTLVEGQGGSQINNIPDATARVKLMIDMMDVAKTSSFVDTSSKTLKIFMAPEFYFRGPYGAYSMEGLKVCKPHQMKPCHNPIMRILLGLRKEVRQAKWKNWMFLFGSIVAYREIQGSYAYWNFVPVMLGGHKDGHHIIRKTWVSPIDFSYCELMVREICIEHPFLRDQNKYENLKNVLPQLQHAGFGTQVDNEFSYGGVRFGLEVCLDHSKNELYWNFILAKELYVDVHLVVSAGMDIKWSGVGPTFLTGPMLLQDGGYGAKTQYICDECQFSDGYNTTPGNRAFSEIDYSEHTRGTKVSVGFDEETPWSPKWFATEGAGSWLDPRFATPEVAQLFYTPDQNLPENFWRPIAPKINFSPPQKVNVPKQGSRVGRVVKKLGLLKRKA